MTTTEYIEGKAEENAIKAAEAMMECTIPPVICSKCNPVLLVKTLAHDLVAETRKEVLREVGGMIDRFTYDEFLAEIEKTGKKGHRHGAFSQAQVDGRDAMKRLLLTVLQEKLKGAL